MPSNFLNDVIANEPKRKAHEEACQRFLAEGGKVTVGTSCIPVPRQPAKVVEKKLTLKQVAKKWREGFYGKDQT